MEWNLYILYLDEAGCPGTLSLPTSNVQPLLCVGGIIIPQAHLKSIAFDFLDIKERFNPSYAKQLNHNLDILLYRLKGSDIRADIRSSSRNRRRRAIGFIDKTLKILEKYGIKIIARAYIKKPREPFEGKPVYTSSMQELCRTFGLFLRT
jgi:hypothetical protein